MYTRYTLHAQPQRVSLQSRFSGFHKLERIHAYRTAYERGDFTEGLPMEPPPSSRTFIYFSDEKLIQENVREVAMEQGGTCLYKKLLTPVSLSHFLSDFVIWNSRLPHACKR